MGEAAREREGGVRLGGGRNPSPERPGILPGITTDHADHMGPTKYFFSLSHTPDLAIIAKSDGFFCSNVCQEGKGDGRVARVFDDESLMKFGVFKI